MDPENTAFGVIVGNAKLLLDIPEGENIGDGSFIKPHLTVIFNIGPLGSMECSTIPLDGHLVLDIPNLRH